MSAIDDRRKATQLAHTDEAIENLQFSYKDFKKEVGRKIQTYWESELQEMARSTHIGRITLSSKYDVLRHKKRQIDVAYTRLRIGHTRLGSHMYRLKLQDSPNCDLCEKPETIEHFLLICPKYLAPRMQLLRDLYPIRIYRLSIELLLTEGDEDANTRTMIRDKVHKFLCNTKAIHRL